MAQMTFGESIDGSDAKRRQQTNRKITIDSSPRYRRRSQGRLTYDRAFLFSADENSSALLTEKRRNFLFSRSVCAMRLLSSLLALVLLAASVQALPFPYLCPAIPAHPPPTDVRHLLASDLSLVMAMGDSIVRLPCFCPSICVHANWPSDLVSSLSLSSNFYY